MTLLTTEAVMLAIINIMDINIVLVGRYYIYLILVILSPNQMTYLQLHRVIT